MSSGDENVFEHVFILFPNGLVAGRQRETKKGEGKPE